MDSSRSKAVLEALREMRPNIRVKGLPAELRKRWPLETDLHAIARRFHPDAFEFHDDENVLALIEIVDTHPISRSKAAMIAAMAVDLDGNEWDVNVVVYDGAGGLMGMVPGITMSSYYLDPFMPRDRDVLPAAMAADRELCRTTPALTDEHMQSAIGRIGP